MDRYWEANGVATPPPVPSVTNGLYPIDLNTISGIPASTPGAWWFHMVSEEIRNLIVALEGSPSFENVNQLATLIQSKGYLTAAANSGIRETSGHKIGLGWNSAQLIASVDNTNFAIASETWVNNQNYAKQGDLASFETWAQQQQATDATKSWVDGQGFATQAGLAAYELWVQQQNFATQGWVNSQGLVNGTWVTNQHYATEAELLAYELSVSNQFSAMQQKINTVASLPGSKSSSGYQYLPNGLILQWITSGGQANGTTVNFPIAFPNACFGVVQSADDGGNNWTSAAYNWTQTSFMTNFTNGHFFAIAIGY